jgi:hypothetical protein
VAAGAEFAAFAETDAAVGNLDVFEHDHCIGPGGDGCAGHDLECAAGGEQLCKGGLAGAEDAGYGQPSASNECRGLDGVAVAGGAVEGREIAIGADGRGEDAVEGFEERDLLHIWHVAAGASRDGRDEALGLLLCSFKDESGGFGVDEDGVHVGLLIVRRGTDELLAPSFRVVVEVSGGKKTAPLEWRRRWL